MKKRDLKKLALMGMAGGLILSGQSASADNNAKQEADFGSYLAAHGCGGSAGGCGGSRGNSYTGNNSGQSQSGNTNSGKNNNSGQQPQAYHSCGNQQPSYDPSGAYSISCSSCGAHRAGSETADAWPVQHSCGGQSSSYYHYPTNQYESQYQYGDQTGYQQQYQDNYNPYQGQPSQQQRSNYNQRGTQTPQSASNVPYYNPGRVVAEAQTTTARKTMTETELLNQLNAQGKATYQSMSPEGKALALKLANQSCKGQNECKGLNSCKTDHNACAGQGGCKGTSPGPFADKNQAVKAAAQKMAEKRSNANKGNAGKTNK